MNITAPEGLLKEVAKLEIVYLTLFVKILRYIIYSFFNVLCEKSLLNSCLNPLNYDQRNFQTAI